MNILTFFLLLAITSSLQSVSVFGNTESLGYYYISLWLGKPPYPQLVILDTGSTRLSVACSSCQSCGTHSLPYYPFKLSQASRYLTCSEGIPCTACQKNQCYFSQFFSEGSSVTGVLIEDFYSLFPQLYPSTRGIIGCHTEETHLFYTQKANGIMGLALSSSLNFVQTLYSKKVISYPTFSICFCLTGGVFTVGGYNISLHSSALKWVPMYDKKFYSIRITRIFLNQIDIQLSSQDFSYIYTSGSIIDSGSTFTYLTEKVFVTIFNKFVRFCEGRCEGERIKINTEPWDCFKKNYQDFMFFEKFPDIRIEIDGEMIVWKAKFYMHEWGQDVYCIGIYSNGIGAGNVFGGNFMRGMDVVFDINKRRIGFAQAKCEGSEFREKGIGILAEDSLLYNLLTISGLTLILSAIACYIYTAFIKRKRKVLKPAIELTTI